MEPWKMSQSFIPRYTSPARPVSLPKYRISKMAMAKVRSTSTEEQVSSSKTMCFSDMFSQAQSKKSRGSEFEADASLKLFNSETSVCKKACRSNSSRHRAAAAMASLDGPC